MHILIVDDEALARARLRTLLADCQAQQPQPRYTVAEAAHAAYRELAATHEVVVCEGAGSPAEINLRAGDYVNMGLARAFDLPIVLVDDIATGDTASTAKILEVMVFAVFAVLAVVSVF